ncbi:MAG TPA: glycosyltransferase family 1 protein [Acidimicrobiales bacterium]|nr:glycosyltransferase family 1 protein [Acidimicrobiales bacterium]
MAEQGPKVLIAAQQLRRRVPGGIGIYARGLLSGLADCARDGQDVDVTLLASRPPARRFPAGATDPLAGFARPVVTSPLPGPFLTRAWDHGLSRAPAGYDAVHSVSLAAPRLRRDSPGALIVTVHDVAWRRHPDATTRRGRRWHEAALHRAARRASALVVPSQLVAADLAAFGVEPGRVTVVPGGTDHLADPDAAATAALLQRVGVSGEFLLTVGTLEPRKNVDRLVRAFERVRRSLPGPWPLVIVGPAGWGPDPNRPPPTDGVIFTGAVSDPVLAGLYQRARAFAYVPLTEGYGLPPLEAMRMGTPSVVANEVPSVNDLGATGDPPARIVDPLDIDDIAAGLGAVLTDDAVRADLMARGADYAFSRTWQAVARQHIDLWRALR